MATVRFGDVAERVNTKEDRLNTDLVYYVGGEHIESNALTVSGRGKIKEADLGPMFYFGFKPGDILFVTRNPHLRKCATVDFPGICSEKTLVIGTKDEDVLSQKYLATVMQSDDFWEFMEENKSGSVNYFINWSTLADYEFDLPPIERQSELANLLWAANDLKESYKKAITATDEMLKAKFREMFGEAGDTSRGGSEPRSKWPMVKLSEIAEYFNGLTYTPNNVVKDAGVIVLRSSNIVGSQISLDDIVRVDCEIKDKLFVRNDDILMCSRNGSAALVGKVAMIKDLPERMTFGAFMMIFRSKYSRFLFEYFKTKSFRDQIKDTQSSVMNQITSKMLANVVVTLPPLSLQREFVAIAERADAAKSALKQSIADIDQVMKGLING